MAFFRKRREKRQTKANFSGPGEWWQWLTSFGGLGLNTKSGPEINADSAMTSSAVFGCNRVISETIASLPVGVFQRTDTGREPAADHPLNEILKNRANEFQTAYEFQEQMASNVNLRGNSINFVQRNARGRVLQVIPLLPVDSVTMEIENGIIIYRWQPPANVNNIGEQKFLPSEIFHPKYLTRDGFWGLSPVEVVRESIGLDITARDYGAKFFGNDATPSTILSVPGTMKEDAEQRLKDGWEKAQGGDNQRGIAVMTGGIKVEQLGLSNEDSQFLETRGFQVGEVARIFRVPTQLLQFMDKASTFASAEQFFKSFVTYTVVPWIVRLENSMNLALLSDSDRRKGFFIKYIVEGLLRADAKTRAEFYASALQNTWMNVNEVREKEDLNPIPGGEIFQNPNITPGEPGQDDGDGDDDGTNTGTQDS